MGDAVPNVKCDFHYVPNSAQPGYTYSMIIEIPSTEDFTQASINLLNLSWQVVSQLLLAYSHSHVIHPDDTPVQEFKRDDGTTFTIGGPDTSYTPEERAAAAEQYWRRSQPHLGNALSLLQQSVEMGFKGRIAAVSPYLLIARDSRDYPKDSTRKDVPFSAFRSLDANELMRVHNTVCHERLPADFGEFWDGLRRVRNVLVHSVPSGERLIRPEPILAGVLRVNRTMHPGTIWFQRRIAYAENDELEAAYAPQGRETYSRVLEEFCAAFAYLPPGVAREYLGYDKRARAYYCPQCLYCSDHDTPPELLIEKFAFLEPRTPEAASVRCAACGEVSPVVRERCKDPECRSNVISADPELDRLCLVCCLDQAVSAEPSD